MLRRLAVVMVAVSVVVLFAGAKAVPKKAPTKTQIFSSVAACNATQAGMSPRGPGDLVPLLTLCEMTERFEVLDPQEECLFWMLEEYCFGSRERAEKMFSYYQMHAPPGAEWE
jgi:hypothetical protein